MAADGFHGVGRQVVGERALLVMPSTAHRAPGDADDYLAEFQCARLAYVRSSEPAAHWLAQNYVGIAEL